MAFGLVYHPTSEVSGTISVKASANILIARPLPEVWDFVADIRNMDTWVNGIRDPRPVSDGKWGVGSAFESEYTYSGKTYTIAYEITGFDPPKRIAMRSTSGPFPFEGCVELREDGYGTRVTNTLDAEPTNIFLTLWFATMGIVLRMMMRTQLRKELTLLKAELEAPESSKPD